MTDLNLVCNQSLLQSRFGIPPDITACLMNMNYAMILTKRRELLGYFRSLRILQEAFNTTMSDLERGGYPVWVVNHKLRAHGGLQIQWSPHGQVLSIELHASAVVKKFDIVRGSFLQESNTGEALILGLDQRYPFVQFVPPSSEQSVKFALPGVLPVVHWMQIAQQRALNDDLIAFVSEYFW